MEILLTINALIVDVIVIYLLFRKPRESKEKEYAVEVSDGEDEYTRKYDIPAYKKRMSEMRYDYYDGVPLYDAAPPKVNTNFTGVEVMTNQMEMELDKRVR